VGKQSDTHLVFEFPVLFYALCLQFLFNHTPFSLKRRHSSTADLNKFCFYANKLQFLFTVVGLTKDEGGLCVGNTAGIPKEL